MLSVVWKAAEDDGATGTPQNPVSWKKRIEPLILQRLYPLSCFLPHGTGRKKTEKTDLRFSNRMVQKN